VTGVQTCALPICVSRPITTKEPQEEKPKWMQKLMEKNNRLAKKKNSYLGA
jgi:hypothetical protein